MTEGPNVEEVESTLGVVAYVSASALCDSLPSCAKELGAYAIDRITTAAYVLNAIADGKELDGELRGLAAGAALDLTSLTIVLERLAGKKSKKVPR